MIVKYFESTTDTLYIKLYRAEVEDTQDWDENTLLDLDGEGRLCAITIEHSSERMGKLELSFEQIPS